MTRHHLHHYHIPARLLFFGAFFILIIFVLLCLNFPSNLSFKKTSSLSGWDLQSVNPNTGIVISVKSTPNIGVINFQYHQSSVEFGIPLTNPSVKQISSGQIAFTTKENNIEPQYIALTNGLKENIVIKNIPTTNQFQSILKTNNADLFLSVDNLPVFLDPKTKEYLFHVEKPYAFDAQGNKTYAVSYQLLKNGTPVPNPATSTKGKFKLLDKLTKITSSSTTTYTLVVKVDSQWLFDKSRVYPITIDPTIVHNTQTQFTVGSLNRIKDTGIGDTTPNLETYYQELPTDQYTVGLWHLNETVGTTVADASGNGNIGTLSSVGLNASSLLNIGASFNGSSSYINIGNASNLQGMNAMTIELWMKPNNGFSSTNWGVVSKHRASYNSENDWSLRDSGTDLTKMMFFATGCTTTMFYVNGKLDNISTSSVTSNTQLQVGNWYHITAIATGCTSLGTNARNAGIGYLELNSAGGVPSLFFNGLIDEVRISNIARTPEQIKADAQRRPYGVYTSPVIDLGTNPTFWNSLSWNELGVATGDGETLANTTGLVAQWNFNETLGTIASIAAGSCGSGCNGTLTNFALTGSQDAAAGTGWTSTNRKWGSGALKFDGSNDYVSVPDNNALDLTNELTLEGWFNFSTNTVIQNLIQKDNANGYSMYLSATGTLCLYIGGGSGYCGNTIVNTGQWHYLSITKSGTTAKTYIDGKLDATLTVLGTIPTNTQALGIGAKTTDTAGPTKGVIDSIRIYSRALTASEILSNYNTGNVEIQTRVGASTDLNNGTWEAWKPTTSETTIASLDSDAANWAWDSTSTYMPQAKSNESNIKVEGSGSLKQIIGQPQVDANTVGLWHLDETSGTGTYLKDSTANANHGTPTGTTATNGISGKAREFTTSGDIINTSGVVTSSTTNISLEAWIKLKTAPTADVATIVYNGSQGANGYGLIIGNGSCGVGGNINVLLAGVVCNATNTTYPLPLNTWTHLALTRDTTTWTLYVNGVINSTGTANPLTPTTITRIGQYNNSVASGADFILDEVRISNIARSPEEIAESYRLGANHYLNRTISTADLSSKTSLPFYVAADRPGQYLNLSVGNNGFANYQPDANTVGLWHLDENVYSYPRSCSSLKLDGVTTSGTYMIDPDGLGGVAAASVYCDMTSDTYGLTRLNSSFSTPSTAYGANDVITHNNVWAACGSLGSAFNVSNITVPYTNVNVQFTRSTSIAQCAGLAGGVTSGTYWNGSSWINNGMCLWSDGIWANATETNMTGLKLTWKMEGPKASNNTITFQSQCSNSSDVGSLQSTVYVKDITAVQDALLKDNSGNNNNSVPLGTTSIQGKIGKGRSFNGSSDQIMVGNNNSLKGFNSVTAEAWVNLNAQQTGGILANTSGGYNLYYSSTSGIRSEAVVTGPVGTSCYGGLLPTNVWLYVTMTYDQQYVRLYLNGALVCQVAETRALVAQDTNGLIIGKYGGFFNGSIDEVRVSNIARSAADIRAAYEVGLRSHPITIDFGAKLDSGNLITGSGDLSFTVDATYYSLSQKGSNLYPGDKIIIKENVDGTEYIAQGTVNSIAASTGAATVNSWDSGSTFPSGGFTINATVFKWQREYFPVNNRTIASQINGITQLSLRLTDGNEGRTVWLDDFKSSGGYLTNNIGSTITSTLGSRYFQYKIIETSSDTAVSPSVNQVTLNYLSNAFPNTPTLINPANSAVSVSLAPTFTLNTTDPDSDFLRYKITLCTNLAMNVGCTTFDQTVNQVGWSGQNTDSGGSYTSGSNATYNPSFLFKPATTYYWISQAIDPAGSNTWSSTQSSPYSFTTINQQPTVNTCTIYEAGDNSYLQPRWQLNSTGFTSLILQKSIDGSAFTTLLTLGAGATGWTDVSILPSHTYQYQVAPIYANGTYGSWCQTSILNLNVPPFDPTPIPTNVTYPERPALVL